MHETIPAASMQASMGDNTPPVEESTGMTDVAQALEQAEDSNPLKPVVLDLVETVEGLKEKCQWLTSDIADIEKELAETAEPSGDSQDSQEDGSLPIQQVTKIWKVGGTIRANKTEHAAALWSDFFERSKQGRDVYYLPTDKVESILKEHFRQDEHHLGVGSSIERSTVHRAMDAMEELAGNLVSSDIIRNGRRALMINEQEFAEFAEAIGATDDVTADMESSVTQGG